MESNDTLNNEVYFGIVPSMKGDRIYGFLEAFIILAGFSIATWCYVQGGYISTMVNLQQMICTSVFGMLFGGLIVCLAAIIPTRYGIDLWIYQRAVFGYKALLLIWFLILTCSFVGPAVNCKLYANSIMLVINSLGGHLGEQWSPWIGLTCVLFGWMIAIKGPIAVRMTSNIMVPCLLGVGLLIMGIVFSKHSLTELFQMKPIWAAPEGSNLNYMIVLEWSFAFIISWYAWLGVIPRLIKTERASYWSHLIAFGGIVALFVLIGGMTGLVMSATTQNPSTDPTEWLVKLGGAKIGILSLILIGFANVTTQAVILYTVSLSAKIIRPSWSYKKVVTLLSVFCGILVLTDFIMQYYTLTLAFLGACSGSGVSLIVSDYFIVRKQRIHLNSLFPDTDAEGNNAYRYTSGINIITAICFLAGAGSYLVAYNPIAAQPNSGIFYYTTATGLSVVVSGGLYILLSLIPQVNHYLRKDIAFLNKRENIKKSQ